MSFLAQNAWPLTMGVAIFMVERFQKNRRSIKNADTSPAEINPTSIMSCQFVSVSLERRLRSSS